ncbi:hypothetical protein SAMN04488543_2653 [Friedmanniella luteola]|uniref:DUF6286 domain-containing protein n=1 Tax=Friedmanniella luteola TaxID=546871 RepID=A0A1H1W5N3_9ACTN|nr:DUF6286 domain-containing protein [Friedmanniella luteola]SDS92467.1 hypothetical protein SAMN04488543_2653 [Friedmanniella luteola]
MRGPTTVALRRRPSRTVPASIVAAVLLAVGAAAVWLAVEALVGGGWSCLGRGVGRALGGQTWGSTTLLTTAGGLVVLGLVLLVAALTPGRPTTVRLAAPRGPVGPARTEFAITRRALGRLVGTAADEVDGVDRVSATARGRTVDVVVTTPSEQTADVAAAVRRRVDRALTDAGVQPTPAARVRVRTRL